MNFALDFRSQGQFFVELILPGGPNHRKKNFENFLKNSKILKY